MESVGENFRCCFVSEKIGVRRSGNTTTSSSNEQVTGMTWLTVSYSIRIFHVFLPLLQQGRELTEKWKTDLPEPTFEKWKIVEVICRDTHTDFIH